MDSKAKSDSKSLVMKCIDSGLGSLGEVSKQVIYSYLAQNHLPREKIPEEPWEFTEALKSLFGRGEEILERSIVREIERTFGLAVNGGTLVELLAAMRMRKGT